MANTKIFFRNIKFTYVDRDPLVDTCVSGDCTMARMKVGDYLRWVRLKDNAYQRNVVNVNRNRVYQKLVHDLLRGAVLPPISLVLPDYSEPLGRKKDMVDVKAFILDGLQRTNCLIIARDYLQGEQQSWNFLQDVDVDEFLTLDQFLGQELRLEIWTNMTMRSILAKMVSLNTGRVQMSIEHQLEILQLPLKKQLEDSTQQKVWLETELNDSTQRSRRESGQFPLSLIVTGMIGYAKQDCHFSKTAEVVEMLGSLDEEERLREANLVTSDRGESDLTFVVGSLAPAFFKKYSSTDDRDGFPENPQLLMSDNETFFVPMMAALGWLRANAASPRQHAALTNRLHHLTRLLGQPGSPDPLGLHYYQKHATAFKSRIGYRRRRLVFEFFRELLGKDESRIDLVWKLAHNAARA